MKTQANASANSSGSGLGGEKARFKKRPPTTIDKRKGIARTPKSLSQKRHAAVAGEGRKRRERTLEMFCNLLSPSSPHS